MASECRRPVRVAVVDDYEIVVAGIAAVLAPYADRVRVVELDVPHRPRRTDLDIVLYDTFGRSEGHESELRELSSHGQVKVVVFSWDTDPERVARAFDHGASGYLAKSLTAEEIVSALERVQAGETVRPADAPTHESAGSSGYQQALTHRETEVLALIAQGLSNPEIADRLHVSINSIKSYVRSGYRKIEVTRRSQAVAWAIAHGFAPDDVEEPSDAR